MGVALCRNADPRHAKSGTELLFRRGWELENEKPPRFTWQTGAVSLLSMITHDGTQVWRNPRLTAA